jgi:hypothetical protein
MNDRLSRRTMLQGPAASAARRDGVSVRTGLRVGLAKYRVSDWAAGLNRRIT